MGRGVPCTGWLLRVTFSVSSAFTVLQTLEERPTTAVCVTGNARTLPEPEVKESLERFVRGLPGSGLVREASPDVFGYVTLEGAPPKGQDGWNWVAANTSRGEALAALAPLQPVQVGVDPRADEVTWENIDSYIKNRKECFSNGYWRRIPNGLRRSLNQLVHIQHCVDMVVEQERRSGQQYEVVVISRPDVVYIGQHPGKDLDLYAVAHHNEFISWKDWVMIMPRRLAGFLLDPKRARPVNCGIGEPCCGNVGQTEVLWEYLIGARPDNRSSCGCGPERSAKKALVHRIDHPFVTIHRPARASDTNPQVS